MAKKKPKAKKIKKPKPLDLSKPYVWVATWFGAGFFRPAPGTWGSLLSIPPALIVFAAWGIEAVLAGIVLIAAIGFDASAKFDKAAGGHDSKMIVIDEAAGQWIALLPVLYFAGLSQIWMIAASFILFRFFDVLKPWPVSWLDRNMDGAAGVMMDDIAAGLLAAICMHGIISYVL